MLLHYLRYQGLTVDAYGLVLDALNLGHPRFSLILGYIIENNKQCQYNF